VHGEKVWQTAKRRDASVTCANVCWWFNMYSDVDWSVTPRPMYLADGRKIPDCYTEPPELRDELQAELGRFPLFKFWGPMAGIESSAWIAAAGEHIEREHSPTLSLVYLPHLDYAFQKYGPGADESRVALRELDGVLDRLLSFYRGRDVGVMIVSEYGIEAVDKPVYVNRVLREAGLLRVREELGREQLDAGASRAFAVVDHQIAHVYVGDAADVSAVAELLAGVDGVGAVLDREAQREGGIGHERGGDLVLEAEAGAWFTYYYWLDDSRAPDYARTVDIHRKPGYDPCELFLASSKCRVARKLLLKKLGVRTLLDVVPLDAGLVRGSHGRRGGAAPVLVTGAGRTSAGASVPAGGVRDVVLEHLFGVVG